MCNERTIRTYDREAARYAARGHYAMEREIAAFLAAVPSAAEGVLLDLGCGPGQYTRRLAAHGRRVVAADLSMGMLKEAVRAGIARPLCADLRCLPLRSECASGGFASASLLHIPRAELPQALSEIFRVLRPGGVLFLTLKVGEGSAWVPMGQGVRFFVYYQPDAVDAMLRGAGFTIVDGWLSPSGTGQECRWLARIARRD
jgi:SAM-dependent methyltransferase